MDFARLDGADPVYDRAVGQWFVFGYDDVRAALVDERLTADRMHGFAERAPADAVAAVRRHAPWVISAEGADYDWIRPIVHAGLRSAADEASARAIAGMADELVGELLERGRFDVVDEYALTLSGWVLADFLGVERRDGDRLVAWALDLVAFFNDVEVTTAASERMARSAAEMVAYVHELLSAHGALSPGGFLDLVAQAAAGRARTLDDEGVGNIVLPFLTGQIGVAHLVANTVWLLLGHDDQRAAVAARSGLAAAATAEALRYAPPVALVPRIALEPVVLGGHVVERGELVQLNLATANRDATRFPDPDRFDVTRSQGGALGFGHGAHSCIGAGLARTQAPIAVATLLRRAPSLELDPEHEPTWCPVAGLQGLERLGVGLAGDPQASSSARSSSGSVTGARQVKRSQT